MNLRYILLIVLITILIYSIYKLYDKSDSIDQLHDKFNAMDEEEIIEIINQPIRDDNYGERFAQAMAVEHVIGDGDFADGMLLQMLHDIRVNDDIQEAAEQIRPVRFNEVAIRFHFPTVKNTNFTVRSDSNNVHDSSLQESVRNKYLRLKEINGKIDKKIISKQLEDDVKRDGRTSVISVYNKTLKESHIQSLNDTEDNVLYNVYHKAKNNPNLKESLFNAMHESFNTNTNSPHCLTGRVSRYLESFTKIDNDPILSDGGISLEILRKEMYDKSALLVKEELNKLSDEQKKLYNDGDEKLGNKIKQTLDTKLTDEYKYMGNPDRIKVIVNDITTAL